MWSKPNQRTKTTPSFRHAISRAFQLASRIPTAFMIKEPQARGALKLREACEYLGGLSVPTIHRLIKRGLLTPNRSTRHLIFPIAELERFLRDGMTDSRMG
jgi:predicted DNA-binding transcriptional regulator AlpA